MILKPKYQLFCALTFHFFVFIVCDNDDYQVEITSNGPIVRGATIRFIAKLEYRNQVPSDKFDYIWYDNAIPSHSKKVTSSSGTVTWDVNFSHDYPPGPYEVRVTIKKYFINILPYEVTSNWLYFNVTDTLTGNLTISQKNITRDGKYISTADPVTNLIKLHDPDAEYITKATTITTFWFIDCIYYGPTKDGQFSHSFPVSGEEHSIDALMIADFNPPPPPPTTTTTTTTTPTPTTTTTTTMKPTTVTPVTTSTSKVPIITNAQLNNTSTKKLLKRSVELQNGEEKIIQNIKMYVNGSLVAYNGSFPYICNGTVAVDEKKSYGIFSRKIVAKAPISSVTVSGNNWLQHGDILTLSVLCDGAPSLRYCVQFRKGAYNATGNETCPIFLSLQTCSFLIQRYLIESTDYTVIIILENDVTKIVKTVAVTIYHVQKQAQLSVIVVPVAFSLVAVVLVIFGVAYYIQNRRRFIVEVADFNFGVDYSDMEYKTFRERLQESFVNAFTRAPSPEPSEPPNWPPNQSQKYGSMT